MQTEIIKHRMERYNQLLKLALLGGFLMILQRELPDA
jgi:hypothetical protein